MMYVVDNKFVNVIITRDYYCIIRSFTKYYFVQIKMSVLNTFDLFGIKQERIDWDKVARTDFEGSMNIEMHSGSLVLNPRLSKNILVCV